MNTFDVTSALIAQLGSPTDPERLFSFAQRVTQDECESYPFNAINELNRFGLSHYYVPVFLGGKFKTLEQLGALLRVVAQRDLAVAITHGITFLGCAAVWINGKPKQQEHLAKDIMSGELVSMSLTEEESGSDLLNMATMAYEQERSYRLVGKKWLVNGATYSRFSVVYAQTKMQRGPRSYSLFLFDKHMTTNGFSLLPKIRTLGTRSADIGGIVFESTVLSADTMIGNEGEGFETILKALQLTRTLCGSLSLGVLDTSINIVLSFALERKVYGKKVTDLPQSQRLLTEAWAEYLICESLNRVVLKALQTIPEQASVHSAIVKYLIPTLTEQAMHKLSVVYGARYYLREGHQTGIFQKMLRDNLLVSLFDGSTQVNLHSLSFQLNSIVKEHTVTEIPHWISEEASRPDFDWERLELYSRGKSDLLACLGSGICSLKNRLINEKKSTESEWALKSLEAIEGSYQQFLKEFDSITPAQYSSGDPWVFELTRRYCVLNATSAVLAELALNYKLLTYSLAASGALTLVLQQLANLLGNNIFLPSACYQMAFNDLVARRGIDGKLSLYR